MNKSFSPPSQPRFSLTDACVSSSITHVISSPSSAIPALVLNTDPWGLTCKGREVMGGSRGKLVKTIKRLQWEWSMLCALKKNRLKDKRARKIIKTSLCYSNNHYEKEKKLAEWHNIKPILPDGQMLNQPGSHTWISHLTNCTVSYTKAVRTSLEAISFQTGSFLFMRQSNRYKTELMSQAHTQIDITAAATFMLPLHWH